MPEPAEGASADLLPHAPVGGATPGRELISLLYGELRQLAGALMAKLPPGQTLQPTALVHEAYLRLARSEDSGWDSRAHFYVAASRAMRDILVDAARRRAALKRGGGRKHVALDDVVPGSQPPSADALLSLDEALKRLERDDPRKGQIVNLRFFAGLTTSDTAAVLGMSEATVKREWRYVRAWLHKELEGEVPPS